MKKLVIITLVCVLLFAVSSVLVVRDVDLPEWLSSNKEETHRLSYKDGDVSYGFISKSGGDTYDQCLVFYTEDLKPDTKYTLSWEIDPSFASDPKWSDNPWQFNQGYSDDDSLYYYFAYDTSYVSGDNQFMLLNSQTKEGLSEGSFVIRSEEEGDIFLLWTLTLTDASVEEAQSAFAYLEKYIVDIVFEEVE